MNKEKYVKNPEDIAFVGKIFDKIQDIQYPSFTKFLSPYERYIAKNICNDYGIRYKFFGGYDCSERCMLGVFPEYIFDIDDFPIKCIKISQHRSKFLKKLTHRDYLGAILGLNIKRELVGDIVLNEEGAYVFVCDSIGEFILLNLKQIGKSHVECVFYDEDIKIINQEFEEVSIVVASLRLDCILSAITGLAREKTKELINNFYVCVNYEPIKNNEKQLKEGDVFSARGFGKFVLKEIGSSTRKNKIRIKIEKYL